MDRSYKIFRLFFLSIIIILTFIFGMNFSKELNYSKNKLIEKEKDNFESKIVIKDNNYENIDFGYEESFINKIAHIIDNFIDNISNKIKN